MEYTFRPAGWARFVIIPFLLFWLAGWGFFEWFAIRFAYDAWRGDPDILQKWIAHPMGWMVGGFGLVWMTFWTIGGASAIFTLLRIVAGVDRIEVSGLEWTIHRGIGPFAFAKRIDVADVKDVWVERRVKRLMLETPSRDLVLTNLGTPEEQKAFAARHAPHAAHDALPRGWVAALDHDGGVVIRRAGVESPGCLVLLAILPVAWFGVLLRFKEHVTGMPAFFGSIVALAFAALAAWGTFQRKEWHVRHGRVATHSRWLGWSRARVIDAHSLDLSFSTDSDGDERATLSGTCDGRKVLLHSTINDSRTITRLARQVEKSSGWRIVMPHQA